MGNGIGEAKINKNAMSMFVKGLVRDGKVTAQSMAELGETVSGKKALKRDVSQIIGDDAISNEEVR